MNLRYRIGNLIRSLGYELTPAWKTHRGDLNLAELAAAALATRGSLGTVLQIGAFDGNLLDPLQQRIIGMAERAILVEPQPAAAARLRSRYQEPIAKGHIVVVEAAIADSDGQATLYSDAESSPKASLNQQHLERFHAECRVTTTVSTLRPDTLLRQFEVEKLEFLQIDTEGMDWTILQMFFECGIHPPIVNFEHLHLSQTQREDARARLTEEGYQWREYGWDTLAVRMEEICPPRMEGQRVHPRHSDPSLKAKAS
jgi:FkbM family methyltransferase